MTHFEFVPLSIRIFVFVRLCVDYDSVPILRCAYIMKPLTVSLKVNDPLMLSAVLGDTIRRFTARNAICNHVSISTCQKCNFATPIDVEQTSSINISKLFIGRFLYSCFPLLTCGSYCVTKNICWEMYSRAVSVNAKSRKALLS